MHKHTGRTGRNTTHVDDDDDDAHVYIYYIGARMVARRRRQQQHDSGSTSTMSTTTTATTTVHILSIYIHVLGVRERAREHTHIMWHIKPTRVVVVVVSPSHRERELCARAPAATQNRVPRAHRAPAPLSIHPASRREPAVCPSS